jgi:peptidoglycan/xylan/chitin deacetylase (PgdA/CDA1 family)
MTFRTKVRAIVLLLLLAVVGPSRLTMASPAQHLSFDRAATSQKVVALTFDADMTPRMSSELKTGKIASWYNQRVTATLREEHVPATLFLAGLWIERYPAVTQDLSADPLFEIGNHSYSHPGFRSPCYGLGSVRKSNQAAEVQRTDALLKKYTTSYQKYFRFPGLCFGAGDIETIEAQGYTVIGGDVYAGDGFEKSATKIVSNVLAHVRSGSIVILHMHGGPNAPRTADALPDIIKKLRLRGYTFVKVSDLLTLSGSKD